MPLASSHQPQQQTQPAGQRTRLDQQQQQQQQQHEGGNPERTRRMSTSGAMHAPLMGPPQPSAFNALDQMYAMDALLLDTGSGALGRAYKPKTISTARGFGKRANGWW